MIDDHAACPSETQQREASPWDAAPGTRHDPDGPVADQILAGQVIRLKRGRLNRFGFEPAWNAYYDFYLSDKYLAGPILKLEDVAFHLFLRKNLNDDDPSWRMPSIPLMKRRLGVSQDKIEAMMARLEQAHLLQKISGRKHECGRPDSTNVYVLSDPIQDLNEFLAVAASGSFPQALKDHWRQAGSNPLPKIGKGDALRGDALPEIGKALRKGGKGALPESDNAPLPEVGNRIQTADQRTSGEQRLPPAASPSALAGSTVSTVERLQGWGIDAAKARVLASQYSREYIAEKIDLLEWMKVHRPGQRPIADSTAWLICAIEENYRVRSQSGRRHSVAHELPPVSAPMAEAGLEQSRSAKAGASKRSEQTLQDESQEVSMLPRREPSAEEQIWTRALKEIAGATTRAAYELLFPRTRLLKLERGVAVVGVPDPNTADTLEYRLGRVICEALRGAGAQVNELRIVAGE